MMRRPSLKWLLKSVLLLTMSGILSFIVTSWLTGNSITKKMTIETSSKQSYRSHHHAGVMMPQQHQQQQQPPPPPQQQQQQQPPLAILNKVSDELSTFTHQRYFTGLERWPPWEESASRQRTTTLDDVKAAGDWQQQQQQQQQLQLVPPSEEKKDWHDYTAMERDAKRVGLGEQGQRATLDDESQVELQRNMSLSNGFNALLSDSISVNRSLNDIRYKGCQNKQYLAKLPTVSVVVPFFNEHFSVLVRSVHSLVNRSPAELLKEIILVDDCSDRDYLFKQLDQYIAENFAKVRVIRLRQRTGLIGARMAGARNASAEVLIFLDSHIEANYNWLPPLLEPIAINKRTSVCPFIDVISDSNFEYRAQDEGARGAFDWKFFYKRLPLLPDDVVDRTKPFRNPVMAGGLFAIAAEFFWELGGYDEGLDIWGGEQYELSFKIWMCGGELLDAPCSRVGHIYRGPRNTMRKPRKGDYLHKNYKRVAEVWMDEYKTHLYEHGNGIYENIDAGDLTAQKAIRNKLRCKSFKWFMETIAFDLVKVYPPVEPANFAQGSLRSVADRSLCLDTLNQPRHSQVGLYPCNKVAAQRQPHNQNWALSWHRDLRLHAGLDCLDVQQSHRNAPVWLWECHGQGGNQFWYYDRSNQWLIHGKNGKRCLEALPTQHKVYVNTCTKDNVNMRWEFGAMNDTALDGFFKDLPPV